MTDTNPQQQAAKVQNPTISPILKSSNIFQSEAKLYSSVLLDSEGNIIYEHIPQKNQKPTINHYDSYRQAHNVQQEQDDNNSCHVQQMNRNSLVPNLVGTSFPNRQSRIEIIFDRDQPIQVSKIHIRFSSQPKQIRKIQQSVININMKSNIAIKQNQNNRNSQHKQKQSDAIKNTKCCTKACNLNVQQKQSVDVSNSQFQIVKTSIQPNKILVEQQSNYIYKKRMKDNIGQIQKKPKDNVIIQGNKTVTQSQRNFCLKNGNQTEDNQVIKHKGCIDRIRDLLLLFKKNND